MLGVAGVAELGEGVVAHAENGGSLTIAMVTSGIHIIITDVALSIWWQCG